MPHSRTWLWLAALTLIVLGVLPQLLREAHPDIAWSIYLAGEILHGARQGSDFLEVNPPLMIWLATPPVLIERLFGIAAWHADALLVAGLACLSLGVSASLLLDLVPSRDSRSRLVLVLAFAGILLPRLDFGQREHFAFLTTLPFVLLAATRLGALPTRAWRAVFIGCLGAVGFALKPYFLLPWLALEALLVRRLGPSALRRPEFVALVAFGGLYALSVVVFVPDYLPMALRLGPWYDRYLNNGILGTIALAGPAVLLLLLIAFAQWAAMVEPDDLSDVLRVACVGFFVAALLQRKGFVYHFLPATSYGLALIARDFQIRRRSTSWRPSHALARAGPLMIAFIMIRSGVDGARELADPHADRYRAEPAYGELLGAVREGARGEPIVVLSSNPATAWPLALDAGVRWGSRYMSLWPLAALYDAELWTRPYRIIEPRPSSHRPTFESHFVDDVVSDFARWTPGLIVVPNPDSTVQGAGGATRIDYLRYFQEDTRFANLFAPYIPWRQVGRYTLWIRRQDS